MSNQFAARVATAAGSSAQSEDWAHTAHDRLVVLDGATARTATGCVHGIAWFTERLGMDLAQRAKRPDLELSDVLAASITAVAEMHRECDLTHPGTPSAAVGLARILGDELQYLILGDISLVLDTSNGLQIISDERVSSTGPEERTEADAHPIGSPEKAAALLAMKAAELAARNTEGGYWIAATEPAAAAHSLHGSVPVQDLGRLGLFTDGAARAATFSLLTWTELLDLAFDDPQKVIDLVREAETSDPLGIRWPRNKVSDDATALVSTIVEA